MDLESKMDSSWKLARRVMLAVSTVASSLNCDSGLNVTCGVTFNACVVNACVRNACVAYRGPLPQVIEGCSIIAATTDGF